MKRLFIFLLTCAALSAQIGRPLLDAHNCYPYEGQHKDRIDRALSTGFPVAIEQDIGYFEGQAVVTHTDKTTGSEPTLKEHFFERVRPIIEKALKDDNRDQWPLIVLHFDFKDLSEPALHAVWDVLKEYEPWLVTAPKPEDAGHIEPFEKKPILVLTEDADVQQQVFFDQIAVGDKLRVFGSAHTKSLTARADVYHRWLNYSWHEVEPEGQDKATAWTAAKNARLKEVVDRAHKLGYWIRFYTLDGYTEPENQGWFATYNFRSHAAVETRWKAALDAGVDMIASDQYEALSAFMQAANTPVIKAETRAVQMNVAVKSKDGRPVRNLRQEDFTLFDDGKPRQIQFFSPDDDSTLASSRTQPTGRVTAIVMDALNTPFSDQSFARTQAIKAIGAMQLNEHVALLAMSPDLTLLANFTTDSAKLLTALERFRPTQPRQLATDVSTLIYRAENSGRPSAERGNHAVAEFMMRMRIETTMASLQGLATRMSVFPGRKSILWLTAGFPPNRDFNDLINRDLNRINDSNVAIYPVDVRGLLPGPGAIINIQLMQEFAAETGGHAYYNRNDVGAPVGEALEDSKFTYVLGFYLNDNDRDYRFHELKVKVDRPNVQLNYRRGYTPPALTTAAAK